MDNQAENLEGRSCSVCCKPATQTCIGCHLRPYCSSEHEQEDWDKHIAKCRPFKVEENDVLGRHLVATRRIDAGEIIMKEKPLVTGPPQSDTAVCLSCYKKLSMGCQRCSLCGWPMCSEECLPIDTHRAECEWTRYKKKEKVNIAGVESSQPIYRSLIVLRCLYQRDTNPSVWSKLLDLESHTKKRMKSGKYEEDRMDIARSLHEFFKLQEDFTEELILKLCGVVQVNSYFNHLTEPRHINIYDSASLIEHSCVPNCAKTFTESEELMIRAVVPILAGEHLSIGYVDTTWGTARRRYVLKKELLECHCRRCADPTELNTFFSAIKCQNPDCIGYVLPQNTIKDEKEDLRNDGTNNDKGQNEDDDEEEAYTGKTNWMCSKCDGEMTSAQVYEILKQIDKDIKNLKTTDVAGHEALLKKLEGKVLHSNHYFLNEIRTNLALTYGRTTNIGLLELLDRQLERKMELCRQVLELSAILFPGDSRSRGMLMFELQESIAEEAKRKIVAGELRTRELKHSLEETEQLLYVADKMLSGEPDSLPEGEVAVVAKKRLLDIEKAEEEGGSKAEVIILDS